MTGSAMRSLAAHERLVKIVAQEIMNNISEPIQQDDFVLAARAAIAAYEQAKGRAK